MSKTKQTNKVRDIAVIETGNMEFVKSEIKAFAFDQETQNLLIKTPEMRPILELYMSLRKLGPQPVAMLLGTKKGKYDLTLIRAAVIGNSLSEGNEKLLIRNYPELVEEYLAAKPEDSRFFSTKAVEEVARTAGLGKLIKKYPRPRYVKEHAQSLGDMFTPEMLEKLKST
ncbi:MAG: hypothetical protein IJ660_03585 [Alphaproteobacteria bacterium]|nr:hypothetical protein [Alphaproteobacteria bacterium]